MQKERSRKTEENISTVNVKDGCKLNFDVF